MTKFTVNPTRLDTYKNFKFRLKLDGRYVAGVGAATGLASRDDAAKPPGRDKYEPITLQRGVTHDAGFQQWAGSNSSGRLQARAMPSAKKNLILEDYDEAGALKAAYALRSAAVADYQAMSELDTSANAMAIQIIKFENEGCSRDTSVPEPSEPEKPKEP
jgi:phage tail-like protein